MLGLVGLQGMVKERPRIAGNVINVPVSSMAKSWVGSVIHKPKVVSHHQIICNL